jgi:hypothetical protein
MINLLITILIITAVANLALYIVVSAIKSAEARLSDGYWLEPESP